MSIYWNETKDEPNVGRIILHVAGVALLGVAAVMAGCPQYRVYDMRLTGEAELAQANFSKQVAVQEANAKLESASLLAKAEVERAKGVAQANQIIGESLRNNESYLRYLWITEVANNQKGATVVYVPTEANIPILEAGKRQ